MWRRVRGRVWGGREEVSQEAREVSDATYPSIPVSQPASQPASQPHSPTHVHVHLGTAHLPSA